MGTGRCWAQGSGLRAGQAEKQQNFLGSYGCFFSLPSSQLGPSEPQDLGVLSVSLLFQLPPAFTSPQKTKQTNKLLKDHWKNKVHWQKKRVTSKPRGNTKTKPKLQECWQLVCPLGKVQSQLHPPGGSGAGNRAESPCWVRSFSPLQCCHLPSKPCWDP